MRAVVLALSLVMSLAVTAPASAQLDPELQAEAGRLWETMPRAGEFLANPSGANWEGWGFSRGPRVLRDASVPGGEITRVRQRRAGTNAYDTGVQVFSAFAVPEGHAVTAAFWVRMRKLPEGQATGSLPVLLQQTAEPYTSFAERTATVGEEWTVVFIGGVTPKDFSERGLALSVQTAGAGQEIEFGPTVLLDLGPGPFSADQLPADQPARP